MINHIMSAKAKRKTRAAALKDVTEENANVVKLESIVLKSNGLNLSDSDDSSDDDDVREKRLRLEKELEKKRETQRKKAKNFSKAKSGKAAVGLQLASLASIVEEEENLWTKKDDYSGDELQLEEVNDSPRKKLDNDVAELLKMGETERGGGGDQDSDDNDGDVVDAGQATSQGEDDDKKEAPQGKS